MAPADATRLAGGRAPGEAVAVEESPPLDPAVAERVAREWLEAWNAHDLDAG
jgi:hypothetical protein